MSRPPADAIKALLDAPLPVVMIEQWTGADGWPTFRVFYLAALFGEDGERFIEVPDYDEAVECARILSTCSGWPIQYRGRSVT